MSIIRKLFGLREAVYFKILRLKFRRIDRKGKEKNNHETSFI
ncbi:hypothetical protein M092_3040 [Parabacteroides distasonis str. 3776 D15 iv]|nr:hypothetical protein M090_2857 [Parabacteroides distasonis str. 3776 Po2 i]KDS69853.1 hypothetical protein M092_3040 [Parabacteroides distasonis str. 3776 D15 iv]